MVRDTKIVVQDTKIVVRDTKIVVGGRHVRRDDLVLR